MDKIDKLMNQQRFFRRLVLIWVMVIITDFYLFIKDPELLKTIGAGGTSIVLGVFGMLATIIGFYQWHRNADDKVLERERERQKEIDGK